MPIPGSNDNRAGRTTIVNNDHGRQWPCPGARWWKFDLHTHTPCSHDTHWHRRRGIDGELTPEQWLQRFMDADIDCVAITDHNSGDVTLESARKVVAAVLDADGVPVPAHADCAKGLLHLKEGSTGTVLDASCNASRPRGMRRY